MVNPTEIDIRLAVGSPSGEAPIKIICPMHARRLGTEDVRGSLAVYRANVHCFGCGFHITRRYASLAFLLGEWDGVGRESSMRVNEAVRRVKSRLAEFAAGAPGKTTWVPPAPSPLEAEAFHRYLLRFAKDRMRAELVGRRGYTHETICTFKLGHTGTHFTIPVYEVTGDLYAMRYRADETLVDTGAETFRKYDGTWGRNAPMLYPSWLFAGVRHVRELWIVEGEYDAISNYQAGHMTITITNGATNIVRILDLVSEHLPQLSVGRWVVATDQDQAGEQAANALLALLDERGELGVRARWNPGYKDLTDYYAHGGSVEDIWYEERVEACLGA